MADATVTLLYTLRGRATALQEQVKDRTLTAADATLAGEIHGKMLRALLAASSSASHDVELEPQALYKCPICNCDFIARAAYNHFRRGGQMKHLDGRCFVFNLDEESAANLPVAYLAIAVQAHDWIERRFVRTYSLASVATAHPAAPTAPPAAPTAPPAAPTARRPDDASVADETELAAVEIALSGLRSQRVAQEATLDAINAEIRAKEKLHRSLELGISTSTVGSTLQAAGRTYAASSQPSPSQAIALAEELRNTWFYPQERFVPLANAFNVPVVDADTRIYLYGFPEAAHLESAGKLWRAGVEVLYDLTTDLLDRYSVIAVVAPGRTEVSRLFRGEFGFRIPFVDHTYIEAIIDAGYNVPWQPYLIDLKGSAEPAPAVPTMHSQIANVKLQWRRDGTTPILESASVVSARGEITVMTLQGSKKPGHSYSTAHQLRRLGALALLINRPVNNHTYFELTGEQVDATLWSNQMSSLKSELTHAGAHLSIAGEDGSTHDGSHAFAPSTSFVLSVTPRNTLPCVAYITAGHQAFKDLSRDPAGVVIRVKMGKTQNAGRRAVNRRTDGLEPNPDVYRHPCATMAEATEVERMWLGMNPDMRLSVQFGYRIDSVGGGLRDQCRSATELHRGGIQDH
jgi:hypothetical protein